MLTYNIWQLKPPSPLAPTLARDMGLDPLRAQLLINRGISDRRSALSFLNPRLHKLLNPMLLKDMDRAVDTILRAVEQKMKITVYGDYDVDGMTSTALLLKFFRSLDIPASCYIPDRFTEGYGLNSRAVEMIAGKGGGLIITVDCGSADHQEINLALKLGMEVVVTDHHQLPETFDPICPVINPHRKDSSFPFQPLAGVGVAFFLVIALRAALRERGWFARRDEPDLRPYLGLVALGTVADVAPLIRQNRILVRSGLERLRDDPGLGIRAIQDTTSSRRGLLTTEDLAFRIAPCLNAAGRMGDARLGVTLLTTEEPGLAYEVAGRLHTLNSRRQSLEREILDQIDREINGGQDLGERRCLVFSGEGWHRGVLGIVASRLKERYYRPSLVLGVEDGVAVGSGRSIKGFDLYRALSRLEPLLEKFGGHRHAAGLTLKESNLGPLARGLEDILQTETEAADFIPILKVDAPVKLSILTDAMVRDLRDLSPFGHENPVPVFYTGSLEVLESSVVGGKHLKLKVRQDGMVRHAIGFNLWPGISLERQRINLVYTPEIHSWQGVERVQLRVMDFEEEIPGRSKLRGPRPGAPFSCRI